MTTTMEKRSMAKRKAERRAAPMRVRVKGRADYIPRFQSAHASGCDLHSSSRRTIIIKPGFFKPVPTGISIELPPGYEAQVRPRSGLARNHGIGVLNSPGTIDADYRGEIIVILFNFGPTPFSVRHRDRIAQMVFGRVERPRFRLVKVLKATARGTGGFGSSGIRPALSSKPLTRAGSNRYRRVVSKRRPGAWKESAR